MMAKPQATPGFYAAHRPHVLPHALEDLRGPDTGVVTLPVRLDWSPGERDYDPADGDDRVWLYTRVIGEAGTVADLSIFLNRSLLVQLWPKLLLPNLVSSDREHRFPELAGR